MPIVTNRVSGSDTFFFFNYAEIGDIKSMIYLKFASLWGMVLISIACTTQDPPSELISPVNIPASILVTPSQTENVTRIQEENPRVHIAFERLEAKTTEHVTLYFVLQVDNPRSIPASMKISQWQLMVNGLAQYEGAHLFLTVEDPTIEAAASVKFPLGLEVNLSKYTDSGEEALDIYLARLEADMVFTFALSEEDATTHFSKEVSFPRIREPKFTVTTIVVNQVELINVRLRVGLRIDNPNKFPLKLSSLTYAFYGDDHFWANGTDPAARHIPAEGSTQTQILMMMNFIDMNRKLLEDILTTKRIYYHFTGEAAVFTTIEYLPHFSMDFELSGNSVVLK
jgi:LEA14-like dessication related protein